MPASRDIVGYLESLHDDYVERVNMAVAENREDLVGELVDAYVDAALFAITASQTAD